MSNVAKSAKAYTPAQSGAVQLCVSKQVTELILSMCEQKFWAGHETPQHIL